MMKIQKQCETNHQKPPKHQFNIKEFFKHKVSMEASVKFEVLQFT